MTYNLHIYKLNLTTNKYEQVNLITCDDDNKAKEDLLYMYKNRDEKPYLKSYRFHYTSKGLNITCKFYHPTNFKTIEPSDYKATFKYEYEFID